MSTIKTNPPSVHTPALAAQTAPASTSNAPAAEATKPASLVEHLQQNSFSATASFAAPAPTASRPHVPPPPPPMDPALTAELRNRKIAAGVKPPELPSQAVRDLQGEVQRLATLTGSERTTARNALAEKVIQNPQLVDEFLSANVSAADKKTFSMNVLEKFSEHGHKTESFRTHTNYMRMVKMMEAIDPNATTKDLARVLRREAYSDSQLQFMGFDMGAGEPNINKDLQSFGLSRLGWQEVTGPDGKTMDIAHSMVALDADMYNPTLGGFKSWLFTDFGDFASGVLSQVGITGAGNNNVVDQRGNNFGDQLVQDNEAYKYNKLSDLLNRSFLLHQNSI